MKIPIEVQELRESAKELINLYPPYRDDPDEKDKAAWKRLEKALKRIDEAEAKALSS